jgi:hypothetical protein
MHALVIEYDIGRYGTDFEKILRKFPFKDGRTADSLKVVLACLIK